LAIQPELEGNTRDVHCDDYAIGICLHVNFQLRYQLAIFDHMMMAQFVSHAWLSNLILAFRGGQTRFYADLFTICEGQKRPLKTSG
jgi:hypothetical protein